MVIQNYVRPLFSDGPHVVHDTSPTVRAALEQIFKSQLSPRQEDALIQLRRVGPLDMTVAWLQVEVELPVEGTQLSYRRARYLHAIAVGGEAGRDLSLDRARTLFEGVYGEDLFQGIRAAQHEMRKHAHPRRADSGHGIFVTGEPRQKPVVGEACGGIGRVDLVERETAPRKWLEGTPPAVPEVTSRATVQAAPTSAVRPRLGPVEAFDRAFANRSTDCVTTATEVPATDFESETASGAAPSSEAAASASLSTLLHARLCDQSSEEDPKGKIVPDPAAREIDPPTR